MILIIDNYDSFSYNLYQLIGELTPDINIIRNDAMTPPEVRSLSPEAIIISPGPGKPEDAGICINVVKELGNQIPILGICLGHQAICAAFGATVSYAKTLMHGKQSEVVLDTTCKLFFNCPKNVPVARYHSLAAIESTIPDTLAITAKAADGEIMAIKSIKHDIYGVQFHPESIMTPDGKQMLKNFIDIAKERTKND